MIAPGHEHVELTDADAVARSVVAARPEAIVHAAIWNDPAGLLSDRRRAWASYVGATRHLVHAANAAAAHMLLISTDWVFDGTQGPACEADTPNPVNAYGFLKAASELVVTETLRVRRGGADRRRAGGAPRAPADPARPGRRIRLSRGVGRARPGPRPALHGLGQS